VGAFSVIIFAPKSMLVGAFSLITRARSRLTKTRENLLLRQERDIPSTALRAGSKKAVGLFSNPSR